MTVIPAKLLDAACKASGMQPGLVARLANLDRKRLTAILRGEAEPSAAELDRCARVFGLRLDDFLEGQAGKAPLTLLLRSSLEGRSGFTQLLTTEIHEALGEFLRVVRDIAECERLLERPARPLPRLALLPARQHEHPGERAARTARKHLGLGLEPVPSVRALVEEQLGIRVVWVTEDQVDRSLDGACTPEPRPAILVNLLAPERFPWRTRITLAHELCHLLFDQKALGRRALVSPHGKLNLFPGFDEIEQRARAFAACFLAPAEGVRDAVGALDPTSEEALTRIGERFGLGRVVAINRLQHVFGLSDEARLRMEARVGEPYAADFDGDRVDKPLGLRGGALYSLVHEGLTRGVLGGVRARKMLGLTVAEPLPFADLEASVRAPLVAREEVIRRRAEQLLAERYPGSGLCAVHAQAEGTGFRIKVDGGGIGARKAVPRGHLLLSGSGELAAGGDHVELPLRERRAHRGG